MTNKTLIAALMAATTLVPGLVLSADGDTKTSTDKATTSSDKATTSTDKATAEKPSSDKAATGTKAASGKSGTDKSTSGKSAGDKATASKGEAAKTGGKSASSAKTEAGKSEAAKSDGTKSDTAKTDAAKPAAAKPEQESAGAGKAAAAGAVGAAAGAAAAATAGAAGASGSAGAGAKVDYTKMTAAELTEYLIFDAKGFKLDQPTQEGKTGKERMTQDELQKVCSSLRGKPVDADTAKKVQELAVASRVYPQGGIVMGNWKNGEALAKEGAGFRLGPKADDNKKMGGNCYACHQMDLKVTAHGTLGPTLTGFGKNRGNTPETQKYVYEILFNAHAYFPCTNMPRFGANGFLNQEQIADLMAYLLDPESPVNH